MCCLCLFATEEKAQVHVTARPRNEVSTKWNRRPSHWKSPLTRMRISSGESRGRPRPGSGSNSTNRVSCLDKTLRFFFTSSLQVQNWDCVTAFRRGVVLFQVSCWTKKSYYLEKRLCPSDMDPVHANMTRTNTIVGWPERNKLHLRFGGYYLELYYMNALRFSHFRMDIQPGSPVPNQVTFSVPLLLRNTVCRSSRICLFFFSLVSLFTWKNNRTKILVIHLPLIDWRGVLTLERIIQNWFYFSPLILLIFFFHISVRLSPISFVETISLLYFLFALSIINTFFYSQYSFRNFLGAAPPCLHGARRVARK